MLMFTFNYIITIVSFNIYFRSFIDIRICSFDNQWIITFTFVGFFNIYFMVSFNMYFMVSFNIYFHGFF